ncbi:MAG: T9SS type A sorting domain-containing protein [Bacteroidia bacterium]
MKKLLLTLASTIFSTALIYAQCSTNSTPGNTSATSCVCKDGTTTDCDLLPDIIIGPPPFYATDNFGIIEFAQTGNPNPADNAKLKVTVSTPNIGHGPLELRTTNTFVCGTDTFYGSAPSICPDGITYPKILINQRVYHKNGNTMSFSDHAAGTMTYHPTHGHMHVDDWGTYTLRTATSNPDPTAWPIVGAGAKLAFCVEDYGTCNTYPGHCVDAAGNTLLSGDFPNYGLGGGAYNCDPNVQGISSGFVDIYWTDLDGMWVNLPPCLPNGIYWLVCKVDPNGNFEEESENNNVFAVQYELKKQDPLALINTDGNLSVCQGTPMQLTVPGAGTYQWSTGATTQDIQVTTGGTYTVSLTSGCGNTSTASVTLNTISVAAPSTTDDYLPAAGSGTLTATGMPTGIMKWYDAAVAGNLLYTGNSFTTPLVNATTTYYAEDNDFIPGPVSHAGPLSNAIGSGTYNTSNARYLIFSAYKSFTLVSVNVVAQSAGNRTIQLRDNVDNVVLSTTVNIPAGASTVPVNFNIIPGNDYRLGLSNSSVANLFRNDGGVTYPYNVNGVLDITSSSAGSSYYYFYYDWVVKEADFDCAGPRTPATVHIGPVGINDFDFTKTVNVYPNPSSALFNISFVAFNEANVQLNITDVAGRMVYNTEEQKVKGLYNKAIDLTGNAKGVYVLKITCGNQIHYQKITLD